MDPYVVAGQVLDAVLVAAAYLLSRVAGSRRRSGRGHRDRDGRGGLGEIIPVLPPGSHVEEVRPDGTAVRVDLPGKPMTSPEQ
jgi:hypothetical protein